MSYNQNISRDSLVKLSRDFQFAVFRSLTSENKKRIYNEKIELLLATESFTTEEIIHLNSLKNYYSEDMYNFDETNPDSFLVSWENFAKNDLGWDEERFEILVCSWMTIGEINSFMPDVTQPELTSIDCTCRYRVGCFALGECKSGCNIPPNGGCGLMSTSNCTGTCPEDIQPATPH